MAWIDVGEGANAQIVALCFFGVFALPFLLIGTWTSPGRRVAELGLTVMIVAGAGVAMALMMLIVMNDPSFKQLIPPDQAMPDLKFAPLLGLVNGLLVGGTGYILRRLGLAGTRQDGPAIEVAVKGLDRRR